MKRKIQSYYNRSYVDQPQEFNEPSLTQQRYFALNDIKTLIARGVINTDAPVYGDQETISYENLMNEKIRLKKDFGDLPIETQRRFGNVSNYLKFVSNFRNYEEVKGEDIDEQMNVDSSNNKVPEGDPEV